MPNRNCLTLWSAVFVLWTLPAETAALRSQVDTVLDGNILDVFHQGKTKRIPINGIDCPEKG